MDWSLPRSEAPESYHIWAGLFTLASVLKRKVLVPKKYLGGWEVSPTLFIIFVAPPGKARKSTTAFYAEDLLRQVPQVKMASSAMTKEVLLKKLADVVDSSISIFSSEFAVFIQKSGVEMFDLLTHLFDANKDISSETLSRGIDFAEKPCVNLLAATTPDWISANMPESIIGGGFASRVIFVFEEKKRRSKLYHTDFDQATALKVKQDLVDDLCHLATDIEGEYAITEQAQSFMEKWYEENDERNPVSNYRLEGYYQRKPAHIHKVAMLFKASYSDELVLEIQDFETAIKLLDNLEKKLPKTFANIGKNQYTTEMDRIVDFVAMKGSVHERDIKAKFYHAAQPYILKQLIDALISMGRLKLINSLGTGEDRITIGNI